MPESNRRFLRIATEEAFAFPGQAELMNAMALQPGEEMDLISWRRRLVPGGRDKVPELLDLDAGRIANMDANGVDIQLLSMTSPGVQMFGVEDAVEVAAASNDHLAEAIARHPTRYAGLASFAPQDPARAVKEMERAANDLGLHGFVVNSHTDGEYLDQEKYWPILEAAEALGKAIYIHPRCPPEIFAPYYRDYGMWSALWAYQAETGLHGMRIIMSGVLDRFPKLKLVLGHMGEGIPYWLYRMDYMANVGKGMNKPDADLKPSEYFKRNFLITTSGMNDPLVLDYAIKALSADNILFAIDYPYQESDEAVAFLDNAPISDEDRRKIYETNSARAFGIDTAQTAADAGLVADALA